MQNTRHPLFQQMFTALTHQHTGNADLAFAYWENVLRLLPEEIRIHREILEECARIVKDAGHTHLHQRLETLVQTYQAVLVETDPPVYQAVYQAMLQQCSSNYALACAYWKQAQAVLTSNSLVITLGVQDLCWHAQQAFQTGNVKRCIDVYEQILQTFPEFLEGYLNLSIIRYQSGHPESAIQVLQRVPERYRQEFIITRYRELYQRLSDVSQQFDYVPYAAIEDLLDDLKLENTFYPSIIGDEFTTLVAEIVNREQRFFEKRRKAFEEKAIARANKRLAEEGIALGQRVTLAKQARREEIPQFLYDNEIRIAEVLLDNRNMTPEDVLVMAQTTSMSEILAQIAKHYKWQAFHPIIMAVLLNPQTLPAVGITLLSRLGINDLTTIVYKKNLSAELRIRAKQQVQERFERLTLADRVAIIEATSGEILRLLDEVSFEIPTFHRQLLGKFADRMDIVINICRWKRTPSDILAQIGRDAQQSGEIAIKFAVLSNPRTPMGSIIALLQGIPKPELRYLLSNRMLPIAVKQAILAIFPDLA